MTALKKLKKAEKNMTGRASFKRGARLFLRLSQRGGRLFASEETKEAVA